MCGSYFEVADEEVDVIRASGRWLAGARGKLLCPECDSVLSDVRSIDIELSRAPEVSPTLFIQSRVCAMDTAILETLGMEDIHASANIGKVFNPDGSLNAKYVTILAHERIMVRGNKDSTHRVCPTCGKLLYTPLGSRYMMIESIKSRGPIYGYDTDGILVCESIHQKLAREWGDSLKFYRIPVSTKAKDGLDDDISFWPTPIQLKQYTPNVPQITG